MTRLLPCPFCGGEAERYDDHDTGSINEGGSCIQCKCCNASSPMHFDRKENLYSSWNERRAVAPLAAALIIELGEPDYKLARLSHGTEPWHYWCWESIERACRALAVSTVTDNR